MPSKELPVVKSERVTIYNQGLIIPKYKRLWDKYIALEVEQLKKYHDNAMKTSASYRKLYNEKPFYTTEADWKKEARKCIEATAGRLGNGSVSVDKNWIRKHFHE